MEPISLILAALAAGAGAGALDELKDEVKEKVKAAYGALNGLVRERFRQAGTPNADVILAEYADDPEGYTIPLTRKLDAAGAGQDDALLAAATAVLALLQEQGRKSGKYTVTVTDSSGVMVGDRNTQNNRFQS